MQNSIKVRAGARFGRLNVIRVRLNSSPRMVSVLCDCGRLHVTRATYLVTGHTRSCGCLQRERREHFGERLLLKRGTRFGRLVILRCFVPEDGGPTQADVRCDCGARKTVLVQNLTTKRTQSCGCFKRERAREANVTHGQSQTSEFNSWQAAKARCFNPHNHAFARYGGRGITMCAKWRNDFSAFLADMGPRPEGSEIDRKDNNGPYSPANCRWATAKQQANNRWNNREVFAHGVAQTIREWSDMTGIPYDNIKQRLRVLKWSPERAISVPVRACNR